MSSTASAAENLLPELLVAIFVSLDLPPTKLSSIALVCRRWNEIVINSSILWKDIRLSIDASKPTAVASPIPFTELCFTRSKMAKITFTLSLRRMSKDDPLFPSLQGLVTKYASRIQELELREFFGLDSLLPFAVDFPVLETVRISYFSMGGVRPDQIFLLPTSLKNLQVQGDFPGRTAGDLFRPLLNIDVACLTTLKVSKLIRKDNFDLSDLPRCSNLQYLEVSAFAESQGPYHVQPLGLPLLPSLIFEGSSMTFCQHFSAFSALSHLTLSTRQPTPSTVPWPSMPRLITVTGHDMHADDMLAIVTNCPMLVAIHYKARAGFVTLLDGLRHRILSKSLYQQSSLKDSSPRDGLIALKYLRLSAVTSRGSVQLDPVAAVVTAAEKLLGVWPQGQLAMIARSLDKTDMHLWDEKELLGAFDCLSIMQSRAKVLIDANHGQGSGIQPLSEMF